MNIRAHKTQIRVRRTHAQPACANVVCSLIVCAKDKMLDETIAQLSTTSAPHTYELFFPSLLILIIVYRTIRRPFSRTMSFVRVLSGVSAYVHRVRSQTEIEGNFRL